MKYLIYPEVPEDFAGRQVFCEACATPNLNAILWMVGDEPSEDFDEKIRQIDAAQLRDFGVQSKHRPDVVEEGEPGLICEKCGREGATQEASA